MIPLRLSCSPLPISEPLVFRLRLSEGESDLPVDGHDAWLLSSNGETADFDLMGFSLTVKAPNIEDLDGDVVMLLPGQQTLHRLIRANSIHNTLLVTERCDQICIMCSQPPKSKHVDMFGVFAEALELAPMNAVIGISGGEPLLYRDELFALMRNAVQVRPDLMFHVLTNGRGFCESDLALLEDIGSQRVLWGIPVYSDQASLHDRIVGKDGAFSELKESLALLGRSGARIEIRTVLMRSNSHELANLARFITRHLPFIDAWAVMQMENIGYGRRVWAEEFFDNSADFALVAEAIDIASARGIEASLFNFPLCTVPERYRPFATQSISDWKRAYRDQCASCSAQPNCCGVFEWHPKKGGFANMEAL